MHWFPLYTSDFIGGTLELSFDERNTYLWMLTIYYEIGRPLPANKARLYNLLKAESVEQKERIDLLANEFFVELDGRLWNERCEKELAVQGKISAEAREKAKKRWEKEKANENNESSDAAALPQQSHSKATAMPSTTTTTTTVKTLKPNPLVPSLRSGTELDKPSGLPKDKTKPQPVVTTANGFELPDWIPKPAWNAYLAHRKSKRATVHPPAIPAIVKKLDKLRTEGNNPLDVLEQSIAQGWTGLFAIKQSRDEARRRKILDWEPPAIDSTAERVEDANE